MPAAVAAQEDIALQHAYITYTAEDNQFYLHCGVFSESRSVFLVRDGKVFEVADVHKPGFKASDKTSVLIDDGGSSADILAIESGDSIALTELCLGQYELQVTLTRPTIRFETVEGSVIGRRYPVFVEEPAVPAVASIAPMSESLKKRAHDRISQSDSNGSTSMSAEDFPSTHFASSSSASKSAVRRRSFFSSSSSQNSRPSSSVTTSGPTRPFAVIEDFNIPKDDSSYLIMHLIPMYCHNNSTAAAWGFEWGTYATGETVHIHQPNSHTNQYPHQIDFYSIGKTRANAKIGVMPDVYSLLLSPLMNSTPRSIRMRFEFAAFNQEIRRRMVRCYIYGPEGVCSKLRSELQKAHDKVMERLKPKPLTQ